MICIECAEEMEQIDVGFYVCVCGTRMEQLDIFTVECDDD